MFPTALVMLQTSISMFQLAPCPESYVEIVVSRHKSCSNGEWTRVRDEFRKLRESQLDVSNIDFSHADLGNCSILVSQPEVIGTQRNHKIYEVLMCLDRSFSGI